MSPVPPPDDPFFRIGVDYIGPFLTSKQGNKYILVCVCHTTRYVEACAVQEQSASEAVDVILSKVIYRHSCPREILVDKGTQFQGKYFSSFNIVYV